MIYTIYDKELNVLSSETLDDKQLKEFIKYVFEFEEDRANFYEFEDENGKKYDCFNFKE